MLVFVLVYVSGYIWIYNLLFEVNKFDGVGYIKSRFIFGEGIYGLSVI